MTAQGREGARRKAPGDKRISMADSHSLFSDAVLSNPVQHEARVSHEASAVDEPLPLTTEPLQPSARFRVAQADAVDLLRSMPDESVDLIVTDPAYESLEKHRAIGTTTRLKHSKSSSNDWFTIFPNSRFPELFREAYRVLRRHSHFYLFCDQETMFAAKPEAEKVGFKFWKPLVWDKKVIGMGYHYRSRYELVLFFEKGKRKLADLSIPDILTAKRIRGGYPSEKPPEVSEILVRQSTAPGALVVDPFMGSGSVGVAALRNGRRFVGGDVCAEAIEIARARLEECRPEERRLEDEGNG